MTQDNENSQIYYTVTLLLSEKRTSLSVLRTGIAIFTLPMSVLTVLVATSRFYDVNLSLHFIIPLLIICIVLLILGLYLVLRSFKRIKDIDHKIHEIKNEAKDMQDIIED